MLIGFIITAVCVAVDQLTKLLLYGKSCSLIGNFLWLEPGFNTGASFSMFSNATIWLTVLSIPAMGFMIYAIVSNKLSQSKFLKISIAFVLGGTIGNFIDRVVMGGVRDFIYLKSIDFAIFNFADIFINIGAYMMIGYIIYAFIKEYKATKQTKNIDEAQTGEAEHTNHIQTNRAENVDEAHTDKTERINKIRVNETENTKIQPSEIKNADDMQPGVTGNINESQVSQIHDKDKLKKEDN